jgi:hypothetical protein
MGLDTNNSFDEWSIPDFSIFQPEEFNKSSTIGRKAMRASSVSRLVASDYGRDM